MVHCLVAAVLGLPAAAGAQATDDSLRMYAVNIVQHPEQSWTGYGIYLGKGLVITAAHVVGQASRTMPSVRIAGLDLTANVIREGSYEREDLTLLSIDEGKLPVSLRLRRMPLCEYPPWTGQPVIVAIPESTARSQVISPMSVPRNLRTQFSTVIRDVVSTGNSGSGVFAVGQKCLLGIMSRKIISRATAEAEPQDIAKYFVPASTIRDFIPAAYRF
jgi:S1-C subfamily serine protease